MTGARIYLYIANKTYSRWRKNEVPDDIRVESLNDYQLEELNRLKGWLYQQRVKARQERDRADRRREREQARTQREIEQPVLLEF